MVDRKLAEALGEAQDKERRKLNLIITNVKESTKTISIEKQRDDLEQAKALIRQITDLSDEEIEEPVRLGKEGGNRPRLLRVKVKSEGKKREIIKKAPTSKVNANIPDKKTRYYFNNDYTPKERETNHKLREELRDRLQKGETNLIIRNGQVIKRKDPPDQPADAGSQKG